MATSCTNQSLYEGLDWCQGEPVLPGIRGAVYYLPKKDIVSWPTLPKATGDPGQHMANLATYNGNFTLAADVVWRKIDVVDKQSNISSEAQGDQPCITSLNKGTFLYPGTKEQATGFARQANSDDLVFIIFEKDGKARVLGNEMFQTTTKVSQQSGSQPTDSAGTTIEVEVTDLCPCPFYPGNIETADGTISGADGNPVSSGSGSGSGSSSN